MIAQGNALGDRAITRFHALKGQNNVETFLTCCALSRLPRIGIPNPQGVALGCLVGPLRGNGQAHASVLTGYAGYSIASRHGLPMPGCDSTCFRRLPSSKRCDSGTSAGST